MTLDVCCDKMDLTIISKTYLKDDCFARDVGCDNCNALGTEFYDVNKGTKSKPIKRELTQLD